MQALTIIHYAKALKHISIGGMFYGAFELGRIGEDGQRHVSLFDMSICNTILNWTSAAEAFIKGGSSNQIRELYEEKAAGEKEGQTKKKKTSGEKTLDSLYDLTNCLNTSRGKMDNSEKKSVRKAFETFQSYYEEMCQENIDAYGERISRIIREVPMSLSCLSYRVGNLRNTLNHFGFQKNPASYEQFQINLEDQYARLEKVMGEFDTYWEV